VVIAPWILGHSPCALFHLTIRGQAAGAQLARRANRMHRLPSGQSAVSSSPNGGSIPSSPLPVRRLIFVGFPPVLSVLFCLSPFVPLPVNPVIPFHAPLVARIHSLAVDIVFHDNYTLFPCVYDLPRATLLDRLEVLAAKEHSSSTATIQLLVRIAHE
jgi:hypothetical protein